MNPNVNGKSYRLGLKSKMLFFALGISILIAFTMASTFLYFANLTIQKNLENQLSSIRETKKKEIIGYFSNKQSDTFALATSSDVRSAYIDFRDGFSSIANSKDKNSPTTYLQEKYIFKSPFPTGKKDELIDAGDNSEYSRTHRKYHAFFRRYIKDKYFYDLFFIDLEGNIVYTVFKELDYATNLNTGKYKDSNLGRLFRAARDSRDQNKIFFEDFENYAPSNDDPASFVATSIVINGKVEGIMALQMPIDEINQSMEDDFLGNHGAVYLIGEDSLFRTSDHRFPDEPFILRKKNQMSAISNALSGKTDVITEENYHGEPVFAAYGTTEILGKKFAIVAEYEKDVAVAPIKELRNIVIVTFFLSFSVVIVITFLLTRFIAGPVLKAVSILSSSTREIATTIEQQEKTAQMQSASVNETSTTMAELGSSARHTAEQSVSVSDKSREAQEAAKHGSEKVSQMVDSMGNLKDRVGVISEQILQLSEKNNQIGGIIGLVSDIANQTNMLALNAAVEAARAGEYGKGFAVVAGEIRKLADESKRSADKIQEILLEIKKATDSTVMATEEGNKKVESSVNLGRDVVQAFEKVFIAINSVFTSTEQITLNVKQQSVAINEVVQAVNSLNRGSQETAIGVSQTKIGIQQVREATSSMMELIDGKSNLTL